jgi:hypothetical protein
LELSSNNLFLKTLIQSKKMPFLSTLFKIITNGAIDYVLYGKSREETEEYKIISAALIDTLSSIEPRRIENLGLIINPDNLNIVDNVNSIVNAYSVEGFPLIENMEEQIEGQVRIERQPFLDRVRNAELNVKRDIEAKEEDKKYECKICLVNVKNTVLLPCKHSIVCNTCAIELLKTTRKCPTCRVNIENVIPFYDS